MEFNESPLFLLLDPELRGPSTKKKLPISLFESELHVLNGTPKMIFVQTPFKIEASETEGITIDHVSKIAPIGDSSKSACTMDPILAKPGSNSPNKLLNEFCIVMCSAPVSEQRARCRQDARSANRHTRQVPPRHEKRCVWFLAARGHGNRLTPYRPSILRRCADRQQLAASYFQHLQPAASHVVRQI